MIGTKEHWNFELKLVNFIYYTYSDAFVHELVDFVIAFSASAIKIHAFLVILVFSLSKLYF